MVTGGPRDAQLCGYSTAVLPPTRAIQMTMNDDSA